MYRENKPRPLAAMSAWTILEEGHQRNGPSKLHWKQSNGFWQEDF